MKEELLTRHQRKRDLMLSNFNSHRKRDLLLLNFIKFCTENASLCCQILICAKRQRHAFFIVEMVSLPAAKKIHKVLSHTGLSSGWCLKQVHLYRASTKINAIFLGKFRHETKSSFFQNTCRLHIRLQWNICWSSVFPYFWHWISWQAV